MRLSIPSKKIEKRGIMRGKKIMKVPLKKRITKKKVFMAIKTVLIVGGVAFFLVFCVWLWNPPEDWEGSSSKAKQETTASVKNITAKSALDDIVVYDYVDPATGVHYLIYSVGYKGGMSPRYNADGTLMVDPIDLNGRE